jgi:hypothetical protein
MEDDLKILKVEYLSNHWSDLPQIWNLSLEDQTKIKFGLEFEVKTTSDRPPMDDNLKILKVEYLSIHWSDLHYISNISLGDQAKVIFG